MTIGIDSSATDFGGSPPYQQNMAQNLHDYQSYSDVEDVVRMYRRALVNSTKQVDIIGTGYPQTLANLLKSPADDISNLTGLQLVTQKVRKLWMMAGIYPSGSENNFRRNSRSISGGNYLCANWPTAITFLGWEVGNPVITGGTLASIFPASEDLLTKALADHGSSSGRSSWDPMTVLLASYGDANMAGYATVKGTNVVDIATGNNTFTLNSNGKHEYVIKLQSDNWYANIINSILEKKSWGARKVGGKQLPRLSQSDTTSPVITPSLPSGTYAGARTVSLSANEGALIFYTTDGTVPTTTSTRYKTPISISTNLTLQFFGIDATGNASAVQSVSYTITPFDQTANLVAYWSASDLSANTDGASIGTWNDKSSSGLTLTSPSSGENPTFSASKNGKPALKFNGTSKFTTPTWALPSEMTVYMRVLWDTLPSANQSIISQDHGTTFPRLWHETVDSTSFKAIGFNQGAGVTDQQNGTLVANNWHTFVAKHTATTIEALFDNVSNGATTSSALNTGSKPITVGGVYNASGVFVEGLNGYITELRIYNVAHDSATISNVISLMG